MKMEKSREVDEIKLGALSLSHVQSLIADTLYTGTDNVRQLAEVIYKRTKGNSFLSAKF